MLKDRLTIIERYPDIESRCIRRKLADHIGIDHENIIIGNGSNELIYLFFRVYNKSRVLIVQPTYSEYKRSASLNGAEVNEFILKWQDGFQLNVEKLINIANKYDLILLCNPNNPTGHLIKKEIILKLLSSADHTLFIIDEAFIDFVDNRTEYEMARDILEFRNLVVLRSMTKFFAIPGLRLGYLVADAKIVERINHIREPWSVNILAQLAGEHILDQSDYINITLQTIKEEKAFLINQLSKFNWLYVYPSEANFLLIRIDTEKLDSKKLSEILMNDDGIAIRDCSNFVGLGDKFFRIAVRRHSDNQKLINSLQKIENIIL